MQAIRDTFEYVDALGLSGSLDVSLNLANRHLATPGDVADSEIYACPLDGDTKDCAQIANLARSYEVRSAEHMPR